MGRHFNGSQGDIPALGIVFGRTLSVYSKHLHVWWLITLFYFDNLVKFYYIVPANINGVFRLQYFVCGISRLMSHKRHGTIKTHVSEECVVTTRLSHKIQGNFVWYICRKLLYLICIHYTF